MNKASLLALFKDARRRAEAGDLDIVAQHEVVSELGKQGLSAEKARAILATLIQAQHVDLTEMERLLDVMDQR